MSAFFDPVSQTWKSVTRRRDTFAWGIFSELVDYFDPPVLPTPDYSKAKIADSATFSARTNAEAVQKQYSEVLKVTPDVCFNLQTKSPISHFHELQLVHGLNVICARDPTTSSAIICPKPMPTCSNVPIDFTVYRAPITPDTIEPAQPSDLFILTGKVGFAVSVFVTSAASTYLTIRVGTFILDSYLGHTCRGYFQSFFPNYRSYTLQEYASKNNITLDQALATHLSTDNKGYNPTPGYCWLQSRRSEHWLDIARNSHPSESPASTLLSAIIAPHQFNPYFTVYWNHIAPSSTPVGPVLCALLVYNQYRAFRRACLTITQPKKFCRNLLLFSCNLALYQLLSCVGFLYSF